MKALQINKYGGSEVVEINSEARQPKAAPEGVLIEIYAAGINPADWKMRQGLFQSVMPLSFPAILGLDFSGKVAEIGAGAEKFKKGDEVFGEASVTVGGSFAEFTAVSVKNIAIKPKNLNFIEAAGLPLTGASAYQVLVEHIALSSGQKILIYGGAGGIGTFAIQIAKHLGAYVATTATGDDIAYVKKLGANEVIDYKNEVFENKLKDFDAVFDTIGGETYTKSFQVLKKGGIIVSMIEKPNTELMEKYAVKAISQYTIVTSERLEKLAELIEKNVLKVHVDTVFPLEEAADALAYVEEGRAKGKVILEIKK